MKKQELCKHCKSLEQRRTHVDGMPIPSRPEWLRKEIERRLDPIDAHEKRIEQINNRRGVFGFRTSV